jgi:putative NADH-flavin reductase
MKLSVFGATGGTGREVVEQALAVGTDVTVLVRDSARLSDKAKGANILIGDVLDLHSVEAALNGVDAVVVSLGSRSDSPENTVSEGTKNIITAMQSLGIKRLVVVTSLGIGDSKNQVPFVFKMVMKTVMRKIMEDKELQEKFVRESGLDWVILRPGELRGGPQSGQYTFGTDRSIMAKAITRADLAEFALVQCVDDRFLQKAVAIT